MDWPEIIAETIAATTLMSLFSHLVSKSFGKLFTEPVLINYVIRISKLELQPKLGSALGWLLHYIAGLVFVIAYHWIWEKWLSDDWTSGLILGALSGIVGILVWMIAFSLPRREPRVAFTEYYIQLFFAHVVFALTAVGVHKIFS